MWKKLSLSLLMALLLCAASNASAQISRHAFEAVAQETLIIERTDGEILKGSLRHVDDERVIVLSEDGDIHDILLADVQRLRVDRARTDAPQTRASSTAPSSTASSSAKQESSYFDAEASDGYFGTQASPAPYNPYRADPPPTTYQAHNGLRLSYEDFAYYQTMIDESRNKRVIGWSFFATGAGFLMLMAMQIHDARALNEKPRVGALAAVGAITTAVGLPIAIAGRHQYRRAGAFAEQAAAERRALEEEARQKARQKESQNSRKDAPGYFNSEPAAVPSSDTDKADPTSPE